MSNNVNLDYLFVYPVPEHGKCEIQAHLQRQKSQGIRQDYTTSFQFFMNRLQFMTERQIALCELGDK